MADIVVFSPHLKNFSSFFLQKGSEPALSGKLLVFALKPGRSHVPVFAGESFFMIRNMKTIEMFVHQPLSVFFQVRRESKDHATLSDLYLNNVITRLTHISEDSARLLKRVSSCIFILFVTELHYY